MNSEQDGYSALKLIGLNGAEKTYRQNFKAVYGVKPIFSVTDLLLEDVADPFGNPAKNFDVEMYKGDSHTFKAVLVPENATNKNVSWTSNNENVATVNGGVITGQNAGDALITARSEDGGFTATCNVKVKTHGGDDNDDDDDKTDLSIDISELNVINGVWELKTGQTVSAHIKSEPAGAVFTAMNLPQGVILNSDGYLSGQVLDPAGNWWSTLTIFAESSSGKTAQKTFSVNITGEDIPEEPSSGGGGCNAGFGLSVLALSALGILARKRK